MVAIASRQLWRRVGGPVALLSEGVGRVTRGRLSDPIPPSDDAVRELAELMEGFNLMQREVREERDAVAAAARREAAQRTERDLWETVQNGLLPSRLPAVRGLKLAARYRPAERALLVGGDFYDAMVLPDGRLAVMVGDMAGHGPSAAAQAAGLRFGWRTLVAVNANPATVLAGLNAQMADPDGRAEGLFASIIYMLVDPTGSVALRARGSPAAGPAHRRRVPAARAALRRPAARACSTRRSGPSPTQPCRRAGRWCSTRTASSRPAAGRTRSASSGPARSSPPSGRRRSSCGWRG